MNNLSPFKLGDCIELFIDHRGKTPAKMGGGWVEQGVRVISALNVHSGFIDNEESIRCVSYDIYKKWMTQDVKRDDCFIASEGASLGENTIWDSDEKIVLGQRLYALRTKKDVLDPWYFAAYMQTKKFRSQIDQISTGSTVFGISQPVLMNVVLLLPKIEEQRKIGKLYKSLKRKLENNLKIINELESMTKTLYDYWFLQFEFPNEEGKPYKSSGGKMVYNEELKREIPVGWEVSELLDLVDWITNSQPPKSDFKYLEEPGYVRFIQNRDYDSSNHVTYIPFKKSLNIVDRLDILMDKYGDAGVVRYGLSGAFNVALAHIKPKNNFMREYIRSVLLSNSMYTYFHNSCMASTRASLSEENLKKVYVIVPPKEILFNYEKKLSSMRNMILKMQDENQELSSLRDFLLPMLMNGQVTFK